MVNPLELSVDQLFLSVDPLSVDPLSVDPLSVDPYLLTLLFFLPLSVIIHWKRRAFRVGGKETL